jgi:hypothetical protein
MALMVDMPGRDEDRHSQDQPPGSHDTSSSLNPYFSVVVNVIRTPSCSCEFQLLVLNIRSAKDTVAKSHQSLLNCTFADERQSSDREESSLLRFGSITADIPGLSLCCLIAPHCHEQMQTRKYQRGGSCDIRAMI